MPRRRRDLPPNTKLRAARERLVSPSGSGRLMSTQELAEAVNTWLWDTYRQQENLTYRDVAALERGEVRWPGERRREAFRAVLGARVDSELGFHINRMASPTGDTPQVVAHDALSTSAVDSTVVSYWSAVAEGYGRVYRTSPPQPFLLNVVMDINDLRLTLDLKLLTAQRRELCGAMARMAGLLATTFVNLSDYRAARGWFRIARRAAEESDDSGLHAWVVVSLGLSLTVDQGIVPGVDLRRLIDCGEGMAAARRGGRVPPWVLVGVRGAV